MYVRNSVCYFCSFPWHSNVARTRRFSPATFCRRSRFHLVLKTVRSSCSHTDCKHTQSAPLRIRSSRSKAHPFVCYQISIPCLSFCILDTLVTPSHICIGKNPDGSWKIAQAKAYTRRLSAAIVFAYCIMDYPECPNAFVR